jgi:hypothetical protein
MPQVGEHEQARCFHFSLHHDLLTVLARDAGGAADIVEREVRVHERLGGGIEPVGGEPREQLLPRGAGQHAPGNEGPGEGIRIFPHPVIITGKRPRRQRRGRPAKNEVSDLEHVEYARQSWLAVVAARHAWHEILRAGVVGRARRLAGDAGEQIAEQRRVDGVIAADVAQAEPLPQPGRQASDPEHAARRGGCHSFQRGDGRVVPLRIGHERVRHGEQHEFEQPAPGGEQRDHAGRDRPGGECRPPEHRQPARRGCRGKRPLKPPPHRHGVGECHDSRDAYAVANRGLQLGTNWFGRRPGAGHEDGRQGRHRHGRNGKSP